MDQPHQNNTPARNRRTEANRANAAKSTGPSTEAGKAVSKLNAVKTALTGRTVLLPEDDVTRYEEHVAQWQTELEPEGPRECALAQAIADSHWRAERIIRLEFALYAQGRLHFAEQFASTHDPALQAQLLEAHTYLTYEKHFRNLSIQEARLRRQREKDQNELRQLQEERKAAEAERRQLLDKATKRYRHARTIGVAFHPAADGFDFSMDEIEANYVRLFGADEEEDEDDEEDIPEPGSRWKPDTAA
jgi:hypothetical protein